jgi:DNA polymerase-3 subunit beta
MMVEEEGSVCVPARKMFEIIKEVEGDVTIETEGEQWLKIKADTSKFRMACRTSADFPAWPVAKEAGKIEAEAKTLSEMIEKTAFATGESDTRYVLNGILFHLMPSDKALVLVGTDGHRMSLSGRTISPSSGEEIKVIIPRKNVYELKKFLDAEGNITVLFGKEHVIFSIGTVEFMARLVGGTYPNYAQIVPKNDKKLLLDREVFLKAIKRASIMANGKNAIRLEFAKGSIAVTSGTTELGEAKDEVPVEYNGDALSIGLNSQYLLDALSAMGGEKIQLELGQALSPVAIRDSADDGYLYVVMPMRL